MYHYLEHVGDIYILITCITHTLIWIICMLIRIPSLDMSALCCKNCSYAVVFVSLLFKFLVSCFLLNEAVYIDCKSLKPLHIRKDKYLIYNNYKLIFTKWLKFEIKNYNTLMWLNVLLFDQEWFVLDIKKNMSNMNSVD